MLLERLTSETKPGPMPQSLPRNQPEYSLPATLEGRLILKLHSPKEMLTVQLVRRRHAGGVHETLRLSVFAIGTTDGAHNTCGNPPRGAQYQSPPDLPLACAIQPRMMPQAAKLTW